MLLDPRAILMFGSNALLLYLTLLVNSALAGWTIYLVLLGPMIVFPTLLLRHKSYFITVLFSGLWVDAALPTPFGFFTIAFLTTGAFIFLCRVRFRSEHNYHAILLAHGLNFFFILLTSLAMGAGNYSSAGYWLQVVATSLASHLVLWILAPWFFHFQRSLLSLCRLDTKPDDLPLS